MCDRLYDYLVNVILFMIIYLSFKIVNLHGHNLFNGLIN